MHIASLSEQMLAIPSEGGCLEKLVALEHLRLKGHRGRADHHESVRDGHDVVALVEGLANLAFHSVDRPAERQPDLARKDEKADRFGLALLGFRAPAALREIAVEHDPTDSDELRLCESRGRFGCGCLVGSSGASVGGYSRQVEIADVPAGFACVVDHRVERCPLAEETGADLEPEGKRLGGVVLQHDPDRLVVGSCTPVERASRNDRKTAWEERLEKRLRLPRAGGAVVGARVEGTKVVDPGGGCLRNRIEADQHNERHNDGRELVQVLRVVHLFPLLHFAEIKRGAPTTLRQDCQSFVEAPLCR